MNKAVDINNCRDMQQLKALIKLIPDDRKHIAEKLAGEIVFITHTLEKLKKEIDEKGVVEEFNQGKQKFLRESPALKSYNTTIQRYSLLYKQFVDLLPKQVQDTAGGELYKFIKQG